MRLYPYINALQPYSYYQSRERFDFAAAAVSRIQATNNRLLALQIGLHHIVWLTGARQGRLLTSSDKSDQLQPLAQYEAGQPEFYHPVDDASQSQPDLPECLPLKSFGKIVGAIHLDQIKYVEPLTEQKRVAVEVLVSYLALLVENLELSQIAQAKQTLLEMLAAARQIGQRLSANTDAPQSLAEFFESSRFLFDADCCFVMTINWETATLHLLADDKPDVAAQNLPEISLDDSPVGWVARTGEALLIPELRSDGRYSQAFEQALGFETRQLLAVPLRVRGEILGVVGIVNKNSGVFDELDLNLLQILAPSAAIALENAHRFAWQKAEAEQRAELYAVASHALRSPMMNILTGVEWILETGVRQKAHRSRLEDIRAQVFNLAKLAGAILDTGRIDRESLPVQLTPVALTPLIKKTLLAFERRFPTHHFELQLTDSIPPAYADESQLEIILDHLVENAVKYSPAASLVQVKLAASSDRVLISICDQGRGIPPDEQDNIFNRYYRGRHQPAKGHSLGLGLYIARKLVQAQGGDIGVKSTVGSGSCFTFTLLPAKIGD